MAVNTIAFRSTLKDGQRLASLFRTLKRRSVRSAVNGPACPTHIWTTEVITMTPSKAVTGFEKYLCGPSAVSKTAISTQKTTRKVSSSEPTMSCWGAPGGGKLSIIIVMTLLTIKSMIMFINHSLKAMALQVCTRLQSSQGGCSSGSSSSSPRRDFRRASPSFSLLSSSSDASSSSKSARASSTTASATFSRKKEVSGISKKK
mmetsp:Transcript_78578/g.188528  ORF Transcript_78578/g.188528 Transcript_78578/m.188528 type:complete len:203 (+) Transcript_78578:455-1063(+)